MKKFAYRHSSRSWREESKYTACLTWLNSTSHQTENVLALSWSSVTSVIERKPEFRLSMHFVVLADVKVTMVAFSTHYQQCDTDRKTRWVSGGRLSWHMHCKAQVHGPDQRQPEHRRSRVLFFSTVRNFQKAHIRTVGIQGNKAQLHGDEVRVSQKHP